MNSCRHCGTLIPVTQSVTPVECPTCGQPLDIPAAPSERVETAALPVESENPVTAYLKTVWKILTTPTEFFSNLRLDGGVTGPLAFALVTHWIGSALEFLWKSVSGGLAVRYLQQILDQMAGMMANDGGDIDSLGRGAWIDQTKAVLQQWLWGAGSVIMDPFTTLFTLLVTAVFVYFGARLLVGPHVRYESALRIICYGMTPTLLRGVPLLGGLVAWIYVLVVTVIGVKQAYRVETGRAVVIAIFPKLVLLALGFLLLLFFLVGLWGLLW